MLVQETRDAGGAPRGLELAFATPRPWLADGKAIRVDRAPTSFGRLSFSLVRSGEVVRIHVVPPPAPTLRLRLRLPFRERIADIRSGGRRIAFDRKTGTIDLSGRRGALDLSAIVIEN